MSTILKDFVLMALPHREWSCEAIHFRVKLCPEPGKLGNKNHTYIILEDLYGFDTNENSLVVLTKILLQRFPHLPPNRVHILIHSRDMSKSLGTKVLRYDLLRDEERQVNLDKKPEDVSEKSGYVSMCTF
ncbi:hypothetical protein [Proteus mirabilis]|uniref:hypothetical protein n=1 Tax=Proteus mirabilis TaxID=584 RepID=UPI003F4AE0F6